MTLIGLATSTTLFLAGCTEGVPSTPKEPDTAPSFAGTVADQSYTVGEAIERLVLPVAAGGNGALSYTLDPAVPGLTFTPGTRTVTGTPTTAGSYRMTYRLADADKNGDGDSHTGSKGMIRTVETGKVNAPAAFRGPGVGTRTPTVQYDWMDHQGGARGCPF